MKFLNDFGMDTAEKTTISIKNPVVNSSGLTLQAGSEKSDPAINMSETKAHRGYLASTLSCRCPRCREGKLFQYPVSASLKKNMLMHKTCPVCGQPTEIEVGFYYGTSYVSYALTVALSVTSLVAWWVIIGLSTEDNRFFYWLGFNSVLLILLQPWLMRLSRSMWISWFVKYDPDWKYHRPIDVSERLNADQANNW